MYVQAFRSAVCFVVLVGLLLSRVGAVGQTPPGPKTQEVVYKIHEDPGDPISPVIFTISMSLEQADSTSDSIGWLVREVRFRQLDDANSTARIWSQLDPPVPTPDGLWWVEHSDPNNLQLGEFALPPHLTGTALADDPSDPDLLYDFEGVAYTPPPDGPPWDPTTALNFDFTLAGDAAPLLATTEEPVGIDDDDDPSGSSS